MSTLTAIDVAAYIEKRGFAGNSWKLQKLTYYAQAWVGAWTGKPLFSDEIEAWRDGPVIRELYKSDRYHRIGGELAGDVTKLTDADKAMIDSVLRFYGQNTGEQLIEQTHSEKPWIDSREGCAPHEHSSRLIPFSAMVKYYAQKAMQSRDVPKAPIIDVALPEEKVVEQSFLKMEDKWSVTLEWLKDK
ncbi:MULTISPECIES: Panacea domain-containing protein [unclassified Corynebacterium]|uniref:Panacea domain-containing protein n=1 Tax=unclassified Corynebacterium TaxID=2624378 RepID=UPI00143DB46A|nr:MULTISPECIES: type II toxin-antitoxin system antitoxin SocA domain-containing protein [unclassified Corynebacterium]